LGTCGENATDSLLGGFFLQKIPRKGFPATQQLFSDTINTSSNLMDPALLVESERSSLETARKVPPSFKKKKKTPKTSILSLTRSAKP
jgi:hypothetical protein